MVGNLEKRLRNAKKECRDTGGFFWVEGVSYHILHRATDINRLLKILETEIEQYGSDCPVFIWHMPNDNFCYIKHYMDLGSSPYELTPLHDKAMFAMLSACMQVEGRGLNAGLLIKAGNKITGDEKITIKCIDELIRGGLLVKAVSGGIWWVGTWRANKDYIPYMYPGAAVDDTGKVYTARRFYGRKAAKNYRPSTYY